MRHSLVDEMKGKLDAGIGAAKSLGATAAKLSFRQTEHTGASFEAGRLKSAESGQDFVYNVEVVVEGRRGSTTGNDLDAIDEMIARAVALARAGAVAHFEDYPPPAALAGVKVYSEKTAALTREEMIAACREIVDKLRDYDNELFVVVNGSRGESEALLVTSGGVSHTARSTLWTLGSYVQRTSGTDMLFAGFGRAWREVNALFDPDFIAGEIIEDLRNGEKIAEAPTGKTKAMLSPQMFGMLFQAVLLGVSGRNVAKGDSPLRGRLGERVLAESITVVDNPQRDYCHGAADIDGDGVPARETTLFEKGVLKNFLYDYDSAGLAGAEPTGNDGCGPHYCEIAAGERPSGEMLADIDDGVYIKALMGFGQSNLINGDFAANVSLGFRVKDGKIAGRVKDTMIAGNVYEMLEGAVELSSDRDEAEHVPYATIEGLTISTAG